MKNVMNNSKKVFLMVALFATVMGYAKNKAINFSGKDVGITTALNLLNAEEGNRFSIKDENGIVIHKGSAQQNGAYKKGFDLTSLPNGSYFFELDKGLKIIVTPFIVKDSEVSFKKEQGKTVHKPLTILKDNYLLISQLSLSKSPLEIEVYYESGFYNDTPYELIHSETIEGALKIERVYKLINYEEGTCKIVYRTEGREFVEFM